MENFVYRMSNCNAGSDKYGVCECCGKPVGTTHLLSQYKVYDHEGEKRTTSHGCRGTVFGHKECLAKLAV